MSAAYLERSMLERQSFINKEQHLDSLADELLEIGDKIRSESRYQAFNFKMISLVRQYMKKPDAALLNKMEGIIRSDELQQISKATTITCKILFYLTHMNYGDVRGDWNYIIQYAQRGIDDLAEEGPLSKRTLATQISLYNNLIYGYFYSGDYEKADKALGSFKDIAANYDKADFDLAPHQADIYIKWASFKLGIYLKTRDWKGGVTFIPEMLEELQGYKVYLSSAYEVVIKHSVVQLYFFSQNHTDAEKHLQLLELLPAIDAMDDYKTSVTVLNLLLLYEKEDFDLLSYQMRNAKLRLKRNKGEYEVVKHFLKMLTKLVGQTKEKQLSILTESARQFTSLEEDTNLKALIRLTELQYWIEERKKFLLK